MQLQEEWCMWMMTIKKDKVRYQANTFQFNEVVYMRKLFFVLLILLFWQKCFCWGFFAHQKINYYAVFLLPPEMMVLYKPNIEFITEHAVDPDKRRYAVAEEGPRHYIDIDHYGKYPFDSLPR